MSFLRVLRDLVRSRIFHHPSTAEPPRCASTALTHAIPGVRPPGRRFCLWAAVALLSGCSAVEQMDGAPVAPPDISEIPDAVPRLEPLSRYGNPPSYVVNGKRYHTLSSNRGYRERGIASWYGTKFHGRRTSTQEVYDMYAMSAAHKSLPLPTYVRVTNLENGRSVVVRVNDRGPFHENRLIDLSYAAAAKLGLLAQGTGLVEVEAVDAQFTSHEVPEPRPVLAAAPELYLQVGAFADRSNAERLKARLVSVGDAPVLISEGVNGLGTIYRVRVGPLASVAKVDSLVDRLARLGVADTHVVLE